jgi:dihydrofolate synthase / folylpolyglutamate synthase
MKEISSYEQAEAYLLGTISEVASPRTSYKLDRIRAFLRELGDPQLAYATIHVGGTSGKGSTCTMIASALQCGGKRTGLHTKPHLHAMTERARVDGLSIERQRFAALLSEMMPAIERTTSRCGRPTYYETLLALSFAYFAEERVDVAVIEVGLGGRLDGTNVITPQVAAITSIGYDHTDVLGGTIESIAFEKAGIAKTGVPLVLAEAPAVAEAIVERTAREVGAPVVHVRDVVRIELDGDAGRGLEQAFSAMTANARYQLRLPLLGVFQRTNAATAIAVLEQLGTELRPNPNAVTRGFANLAIPGRMELVAGHPAVLFDIAHNVEKAESLVASLREHFAGRRMHYVVAIGESKDARRILQTLASLPSSFTFTSFSVAGRPAITPQRLATIAQTFGAVGRAIGDPSEALTVARRMAAADDVVVVTGSTFLVATLREWYTPTAVC